MTSLSALQSTIPLSNVPSTALKNAGLTLASPNLIQPQTTPQQSTIVTMSSSNAKPESTYSIARTVPTALPSIIWKMSSTDAVSSLMAGNFFSHSLGNRLKGIGSALMDMLQNGANEFSQSVMQSPTESMAIALPGTQKTSYPWAEEKLLIQTKSGIDVEVVLKSQDDLLEVQLKSSGELSDAERIALGKLSEAFQDAVDGLSAKPPILNLGGLTKFDATVLASVDLHSMITLEHQTPQTLDFHADSVTRTLNLDGPIGALNVNDDE